jgi:hypothetical protein
VPPVTSIIRFVVSPAQIVVSPLKAELVGPTCEIAILDRNKEVINKEKPFIFMNANEDSIKLLLFLLII